MFKKFLFSMSCIFAFLLPLAVKAAGFYFLPQENKVITGENFIIEVRLDSGAQAANAVEVLINFPKDEIMAIDFLTGGSAIDSWIKKPEISNEKGTVSFIGGATSGFSKDDILGRLVLRPKKEGTIKLNFDETSRALLANGHGSPLELENLEAVYIAAARSPDLPLIGSTSHPNSNQWSSSPNLEVHWNLKKGAEYSYLLSKDSLAMPDETAEAVIGSIEFFGLDDGIYYFHLREKPAGGQWSGKSTYRVMIDANPPSFSEILADKDKNLFNKKYFVAWIANDAVSGIDYYEVCEGEKKCLRAESPYVLQNQWLGEDITVRAYDGAGHMREAKIRPAMVLPAYIYLFAAIILLLISVAVFMIIRRHKKYNG